MQRTVAKYVTLGCAAVYGGCIIAGSINPALDSALTAPVVLSFLIGVFSYASWSSHD